MTRPSATLRCPSCKETFPAPAGAERVDCPHCGKGMRIAPTGAAAKPKNVATAPAGIAPSFGNQCVRCKHHLAPGNTVCPRCHTLVATGNRLPLLQRMQRLRLRTGMTLLISVLALGVIAYLVKDFLDQRNRLQQPPHTVSLSVPSATQPTTHAREQIVALLGARNAAERKAAVEALRPQGAPTLDLLVSSLNEIPTSVPKMERTRNLHAVIALLTAGGAAGHLPALEELGREPELHDDALIARALLGDPRVSAEIVSLWSVALQERLFLERVAVLASAEEQPSLRSAALRSAAREGRLTAALRELGVVPESNVLGQVLALYWRSWGWLGQQRDERSASEIFDCAKLSGAAGEDVKESVRAARRSLEASSASQPEITAAALLVLTNEAPQYESLRREMQKRLVEALPTASPAIQQRLTWTVARTAGGSVAGALRHPADVDSTTVRAVLDWARGAGIASITTPPHPSRATPPIPTLRVCSVRRQHQDALLPNLRSPDWDASRAALREWLAADLGYPPATQALLAPETADRSPPALAAALTLAGRYGGSAERARLQTWRESADQPPWVRDLASTALAMQALRNGDSAGNWPLGISNPLDGNVIEHLAQLVISGGAKAEAALRGAKEQALQSADRRSLLSEISEIRAGVEY